MKCCLQFYKQIKLSKIEDLKAKMNEIKCEIQREQQSDSQVSETVRSIISSQPQKINKELVSY